MKTNSHTQKRNKVLSLILALALIFAATLPGSFGVVADDNSDPSIASESDAENQDESKQTEASENKESETTEANSVEEEKLKLRTSKMMLNIKGDVDNMLALGAGNEARPIEELLNGETPTGNIIDKDKADHTINLLQVDMSSGATFYPDGYHDSDMLSPDNLNSEGLKTSGGMDINGGERINGAYVWSADSSAKNHNFVYMLRFSMSGVGSSTEGGESVKPGDIRMYVPSHIIKDSTGSYADTVTLSVPDISLIEKTVDGDGNVVYVTDHEFAYHEVEINGKTYCVIENIKEVSAGVVYEIPVKYSTTKNTYEYTDLGESDAFKAYVDLRTKDSETQEVGYLYSSSNQIPVHINTGVKIESATKKAETSALSADALKNKYGAAAFSGVDISDDYYYVVWSVTSKITNVTQKYNFKLTEQNESLVLTGNDAEGKSHTVNGEVVAIKLSGASTYTDGKEATSDPSTASGNRTDYVLTRFPKIGDGVEGMNDIIAAPRKGTYNAGNSADSTVIPVDGEDKEVAKSSTATWRYELQDPNYAPPLESYKSNKYGLYNNGRNIVTSSGNVTSYDMEELTKTEGESKPIDLKYRINANAYAYTKTVQSINNEIRNMTIEEGDGFFSVKLGDNITYIHNSTMDSNVYQIQTSSGTEPVTLDTDVTLLDLKHAAADYLRDQYGKVDVKYSLVDKNLKFVDYKNPNDVSKQQVLQNGDYYINSVDYTYSAFDVGYNSDSMTYYAKEVDDFSETEAVDQIIIYAYLDGTDEPIEVATVNMDDGSSDIEKTDIVQDVSTSKVSFVKGSNVTGYKIEVKNRYYYSEILAEPTVTLLPSQNVANYINEKVDSNIYKVGINNTANWIVENAVEDEKKANQTISGIDYIAKAVKHSKLQKQALNSDLDIIGMDGNAYNTGDDILYRKYTVAWKTTVEETVEGQDGNSGIEPVAQKSGRFYDLLPSYSDVIPGSLKVIAYNYDSNGNVKPEVLPASAIKLNKRIDNYKNSGKKLMIIDINAPCDVRYEVTYATVHTFDDIQDYGRYAVNTVAYQTGNDDIGDGFPDNGGDKFFAAYDYMKNLDENNGDAKRFIYGTANADLDALISSSSGIYKKVSSSETVVPSGTAYVTQGDEYIYTVRMKNTQGTRAFDIAILDSLENFQTVGEGADAVSYNSAPSRFKCDWQGTIKRFNLSGLETKMKLQNESFKPILFLYTGEEPIDFEDTRYSDAQDRKELLKRILAGNAGSEGWVMADDWENPNVDLSTVKAFIVYLGTEYKLGESDSLSFTVTMESPATVPDSRMDAETGFEMPPATYNNIYRSFKSTPVDNDDLKTYYYTHYDYTKTVFTTTADLSFGKVDSATNNPVGSTVFHLSGTSDYGTVVDTLLYSDAQGRVLYSGLEKGTYTLQEEDSGFDHLLDPTPYRVKVTPKGDMMIVDIDTFDGSSASVSKTDIAGNTIFYDQDTDSYEFQETDPKKRTNYKISNDPRIHGNVEFSKRDIYSNSEVAGAWFRLTGVSAYGTEYDKVAESDLQGNVVFENIELSSATPYVLTEIDTPAQYMPVNGSCNVTVNEGANAAAVVSIEGVGDVSIDTINNVIYNTPFAKLDIRKNDSITLDGINDAEFTLETADSETFDKINVVANKKAELGLKTAWVNDGTIYKQTFSQGNVGPVGEYLFGELLPGTYKLTETAPSKYSKYTEYYVLTVTEDEKGYTYKLKDEDGGTKGIRYIKQDGDKFVVVDKEQDAESYRILNDEKYEEEKLVIKSWIGTPMADKFPVMHLSTEKPQAKLATVQIGSAFKNVSNNKSNITSFERAGSLPDGMTPSDIPDSWMNPANTNGGHFYAWVDGTTLKWWSDAYVIYLPTDCSSLFEGYNNLTTLDLTNFTTKDVTSMKSMFKDCSNLQTINLDHNKFTAGESLTSVASMFQNCNALTGIDLRGFGDCKELTYVNSWFQKCYNLTYIDLKNFQTSAKLKNLSCCFQYTGTGTDASSDNSNPQFPPNGGVQCCQVFETHDWQYANDATKTKLSQYFRINLYGCYYKNGRDDNAASLAVAQYNGDNERVSESYVDNRFYRAENYFTDANSDYYTRWAAAHYNKTDDGSSEDTEPVSTDIDLPSTFTFEETKVVDDTTATADDVGNRYFTFEYKTGETGTDNGDETFTVDETVYLTVTDILMDEDGHIYEQKTVYKYNPETPIKATWSSVNRTATSQWECKMKVFNSMDEFFAWEDEVKNYESTALSDNPVSAASGETPVITNSSTDTPVGSIELKKELKNDPSDTDTLSPRTGDESFWFKVTIKTNEDDPYTMKPFDENGVAYFSVGAGDSKIISGIPAGYKYTVEEVKDPKDSGTHKDHYMPEGYSYVPGDDTTEKTIVAGTPGVVTITNEVDSKILEISKSAKLYKQRGNETPQEVTDDTDTDYIEWMATEFPYEVTFSNLYPETNYKYHIENDDSSISDGSLKSFTSDADGKYQLTGEEKIEIKPGQKIVFEDLPINANYTVKEVLGEEYKDDETVSYRTTYRVNDETDETEEMSYSGKIDREKSQVSYTNTKTIYLPDPDILSLTFTKNWVGSDGNPITDPDQLPDSLSVYLGRYSVDSSNNMVLDNYRLQTITLNKEEYADSPSKWSYTFVDLPRYKDDEKTIKYNYFVRESDTSGFNLVETTGYEKVKLESFDTEIVFGKFKTAEADETEMTAMMTNKAVDTVKFTFSKEVSGNLANRHKQFTFYVTLYDSKGNALAGPGYWVQKTVNGTALDKVLLTVDGKIRVDLVHGETYSFLNLPVGTKVKLEEEDYSAEGYKPKAEITVGEDSEAETSDFQNGSAVTVEQDTTVEYTNVRKVNVPTGVRIGGLLLIVMGVAILGIIGINIRRQKRLKAEK